MAVPWIANAPAGAISPLSSRMERADEMLEKTPDGRETPANGPD